MKLEVKNLSFAYKNRKPLWEHVSFSVEKGEIFSILGSNGAGKSTLLRTLIGFLAPKEGTVAFYDREGQPYDARDGGSDFTKHIGYVPQIQDSAYSFALKDYILMGSAPRLSLFQSPGEEDRKRADEIMNEMGIYEEKDQPFDTLSGGQQRQAVIARAILQNPDMIIMDEPTNHLDYGNQYRVMQLIEKLSDRGMAVILTTHMPDHALYLGNKTGILMNRTMVTGPAKEIITEKNLETIYHIPVKMIHLKELDRVICVAGK